MFVPNVSDCDIRDAIAENTTSAEKTEKLAESDGGAVRNLKEHITLAAGFNAPHLLVITLGNMSSNEANSRKD
jgi:hypothetical protein